MDIAEFLASVEGSGLAGTIRDSLYLFPLLEAAHVFGLSLVFGTIAVIDLRLLGLASSHRSFRKMSSDILKWTWAAFAITAITGVLMFITNAAVYYHNTFFRIKMALLVAAGINMLVFELTAGRTIHRWDKGLPTPGGAKAAGALSIALWLSIIFMGRWIGFTTTRATVAPPPEEINLDDLFGPATDPAPEAPAPDGIPAPDSPVEK